jgi:hypothetical protein
VSLYFNGKRPVSLTDIAGSNPARGTDR